MDDPSARDRKSRNRRDPADRAGLIIATMAILALAAVLVLHGYFHLF